jgi:hypothetical protein
LIRAGPKNSRRDLQPCLGKSSPRSGLQILLKSDCAWFVSKRDVVLDTPRAELQRVSHRARIVFREPGVQVVGDTGVEMLACEALKDVDVFHDSAFTKATARQPSLREGWWRRRESNPRPKSLSARRGSMLSPVPDGFAPCAQNGQDAHETSPMISR